MTAASSPAFAISLADIQAAAGLIAPDILRTPTLPSPRLSALTGADIQVKHENMQATASFKDRGAANKLKRLSTEERARGVIAMSAGNHAQSVAFHAQRLGIPAVIVMPETTPLVKIENTRALGARVVLSGETLADSAIEARRLAEADSLVMVHPYDDPAVMAGQGTIALEMLADAPDLDTLVVPIGGGGLISGIAIAAKALKPSIRIIGVEAALYPSCHNALKGLDQPIGGATLAEGIAVKTIGGLTLPVIRALVDEVLLVDEPALERAVHCFATLQRSLAEGAGAAGLAAVLSEPTRFAGRKVGLVLCGGNIDARMLATVMVRELEREQRIIALRITAPDRPGLLGRLATRLGDLGANILEVEHGRLFLDVPAKGVSVEITVEARDTAHGEQILAALEADGYQPRRIHPRNLGA